MAKLNKELLPCLYKLGCKEIIGFGDFVKDDGVCIHIEDMMDRMYYSAGLFLCGISNTFYIDDALRFLIIINSFYTKHNINYLGVIPKELYLEHKQYFKALNIKIKDVSSSFNEPQIKLLFRNVNKRVSNGLILI